MNKATFSMGCFWGPQVLFKKIPGVVRTTVGYAGGHKKDPTYEDVCSGNTGHAESIEIEFDPSIVTYDSLLDTFFEHHDPTTLNRQGPDIGEQYRSVIFYHDESQKEVALEFKDRLERNNRYHRPIVTEIIPAKEFYRAEEYHQDYAEKNPSYVCHI
ncbi:MAG: peptide-methionine (S)-S-oxide reductase MsrA [Minisyncoccota bacterium]